MFDIFVLINLVGNRSDKWFILWKILPSLFNYRPGDWTSKFFFFSHFLEISIIVNNYFIFYMETFSEILNLTNKIWLNIPCISQSRWIWLLIGIWYLICFIITFIWKLSNYLVVSGAFNEWFKIRNGIKSILYSILILVHELILHFLDMFLRNFHLFITFLILEDINKFLLVLSRCDWWSTFCFKVFTKGNNSVLFLFQRLILASQSWSFCLLRSVTFLIWAWADKWHFSWFSPSSFACVGDVINIVHDSRVNNSMILTLVFRFAILYWWMRLSTLFFKIFDNLIKFFDFI